MWLNWAEDNIKSMISLNQRSRDQSAKVQTLGDHTATRSDHTAQVLQNGWYSIEDSRIRSIFQSNLPDQKSQVIDLRRKHTFDSSLLPLGTVMC